MSQFDPEFDDPALKAAVKRALGSETAPALLRARIESLRAPQRRRWPMYGLAAAAALMIGLGLTYFLVWRTTDQPVPQYFADAMVVTHDQDLAMPNHHLMPGIDDTNLPVLRQTLENRLGHPVFTAMLDEGWKYEGAGLCQISKVPAAELLFTRGDESISIFSVASAAFYADSSSNTTYAQIDNHHEISGFVAGGAIHCLVGYSPSGQLSLKEVTRLRDKLRDSQSLAYAVDLCAVH